MSNALFHRFRCVMIGLGLLMSGCATTPISQARLQLYPVLPQGLAVNRAEVTEIDRGLNRLALQMTAEGKISCLA